MLGPMKITVDVDDLLYRAVKVEAARSDRSVREIVAEALEHWLQEVEDEEDLRAAQAALEEYERVGGTPAEEVYQHLAAEARARYGSKGGQSGG